MGGGRAEKIGELLVRVGRQGVRHQNEWDSGGLFSKGGSGSFWLMLCPLVGDGPSGVFGWSVP